MHFPKGSAGCLPWDYEEEKRVWIVALQKVTGIKFLCSFRLAAKSLRLSSDKRLVYGIGVFIDSGEAVACIFTEKIGCQMRHISSRCMCIPFFRELVG